MQAVVWFDAWVLRGTFDPRDVAAYRIIFAALVLLFAPRLPEFAAYPNSLFDPPPSPLRLLTGYPPQSVLIAIQILMYVLLIATALGLYTMFCSLSLSIVLIGVYGLTFSVGHIDHLMVMAIVPAIMAFSRLATPCRSTRFANAGPPLQRDRPDRLRQRCSPPSQSSRSGHCDSWPCLSALRSRRRLCRSC